MATESLGLQGDVRHEVWLTQTRRGVAGYAEPVIRRALIVEGQQQHQTLDGRTLTVRACVSILPTAEGEPPPDVGLRDRLTLPSGLTGPIVDLPPAFVDPATGRAAVRTVWLG